MSSNRGRVEIAHRLYPAFAAGERDLVEELLAADFTFHSPPDPDLDRDGYFEKCWPNSANLSGFEFVRTIVAGDEAVVTYEATRVDGSRFRNTEVLAFEGEKVVSAEVYFGWELD